jgi:hypothetical protein
MTNKFKNDLCEVYDPGGVDLDNNLVISSDSSRSVIQSTEIIGLVSKRVGEAMQNYFQSVTGEREGVICVFRTGVLVPMLGPDRRADAGFVIERIMFDSGALQCSYISKQLVDSRRPQFLGAIEPYKSKVTLGIQRQLWRSVNVLMFI